MTLASWLLTGLIGLFVLLFLLYQRNKKALKTSPAEQGQYYESTRGKIFFLRRGHKKKPTLLLLHGIGASSYCWRLLSPLLETHFDLIIIDFLGFGSSHKDPNQKVNPAFHEEVLFELMDHLKVKDLHIVGCSMGAAIGLWMAANSPSRILKIVSLSPASHPKLVPSFVPYMTWLANISPWVVGKATIHHLLRNLYFDKSVASTEALQEYWRPYKNSDAHSTFAQHLCLLGSSDSYLSLHKVSQPTLVLWGINDRLVRKKHISEIINQLHPDFYFEHPSGGHHLMEEDPDWCRDKILTFLLS